MIQEVIERLKAECPELADVQAAEEIAALSKGTAPRHGTAFVLPYRERAEPNELVGAFRQTVTEQLLIAIIFRRHDDASGGKKAALFDSLKGAVEAALAGWQPEFVEAAFELVSGQAAPLGNGATVYVQTWETTRLLKGA